MATVPTPATQVAGTVVPAATVNSQGNLATYLAGRTESGGARKPLCKMRQTVTMSFTTSGASQLVTFDTEDVDYDNGHSTVSNTSRYTAGTAGWYQISYGCGFQSNATGQREVFLRLNGATSLPASSVVVQAANGDVTSIASSLLVFLNVGDFVEVMGYQNSGGALSSWVTTPGQPFMCVQWVSV